MATATWGKVQRKGQRWSFQNFGGILSTHCIVCLSCLTSDSPPYKRSSQLYNTSTSAVCCTRFHTVPHTQPSFFQVREVTATFKGSTCIQRVKQVSKGQMPCPLSSFRWSLILGSFWRCEQDSWLSLLSNTCKQQLWLSGRRENHLAKEVTTSGGGRTRLFSFAVS